MEETRISIKDYETSGAGALGESYISKNNPNILLKLYSREREQMGYDEYERACKVYRIGVPCPTPGELVRTEEGLLGIQFHRIVGKKSYARALSEHPEKLEEYAARFAEECKKLHSIHPEPGLFPTAKEQCLSHIRLDKFLSDEEKMGLERYVNNLPDADTALHGDLHYGNIIFTEDGKQYFIDLGDFCTGSPLFDLAIIYRQTCLMPEAFIKENYHIDAATAKAFWHAFVPHYFGADARIEEVEAMLEPYNTLRSLALEQSLGEYRPAIRPSLQKMIGSTKLSHNDELLAQYRSLMPVYNKMVEVIPEMLKDFFDKKGIVVAAVEQRVKSENSLAGKLKLKGDKYRDIYDITDIVGVRVITFYTDDVDKVASVLERLFEIDWENSIDKRKIHDIDSFGYLSLHYICRIPELSYTMPGHPELNKIRFEVQMRTVLQHAWSNMDHDTGYKSGVEIPKIYKRNLSRLAGMLELVDDEFSRIRRELNDYRRRVQTLVASGNLDEVLLDGDSFKSYLKIGPFDALMRRIASINQAEIKTVDMSPFLALFKAMGFNTLGDVAKLVKEYSDAAYQISCFQMGITDLDIIASSVAPQNLCTAYILKNGGGKAGLKMMFDILNGPSDDNVFIADFLMEQSRDYPFMNK